MDNKPISASLQKGKSNWWIWLIIAIVVLGLALVCCILVIAGVLFFQIRTPALELPPAPVSTSISSVATVPAELSLASISEILDVKASPASGPIDLQRGFSPDPRVVRMGSRGDVDTSASDLPCGFTTTTPTFAFHLSGGASDTFLRIYFAPDDKVNSTLIVHTPDDQWLCGNKAAGGTAAAPVVDIEFAPSGQYAVWVGLQQGSASVLGALNITGSRENTP